MSNHNSMSFLVEIVLLDYNVPIAGYNLIVKAKSLDEAIEKAVKYDKQSDEPLLTSDDGEGDEESVTAQLLSEIVRIGDE
jgi:hypothetical protein